MKLGLLLAAVGMVASCGAGGSLSQSDVNVLMSKKLVSEACYASGMGTNEAALARTHRKSEQMLSGRASAAQLQEAQRHVQSLGQPQPHHCRIVEMEGLQELQKDGEKARQAERTARTTAELAQMNRDIQQMNANRPRTVSCQHMEWGNTTFCNSF